MKRKFVRKVIIAVLLAGLLSGLGMAEQKSELQIQPVRKLLTKTPLFGGGPTFLSAASGLVRFGNTFYAVADDAHELIKFRGDEAGVHQPLLHRPDLPADMEFRKKVKPDFECLTLVDTARGPALLALGSGSGEHRFSGALVHLGWFGQPGATKEFDLAPLYADLEKKLPGLNIEGVSVVRNRLRLLQRGSGASNPNAIIDLDLERFLTNAQNGTSSEDTIVNIREVDLGDIPGKNHRVRWTFTDLCPLTNGRCLFTATAEDTPNPYHDGEILGSAIGIVEYDGTISFLQKVNLKVKLEGIAIDNGVVYLVNDADNPARPAQLFQIKEF